MEQSNSSGSISWKEAKAHGNGNLFKNHEKRVLWRAGEIKEERGCLDSLL